MDTVEKLVKQRAFVMAAAGAAFIVWQGFTLVSDLVLTGTDASLLVGSGKLLGGVFWVLAMVAFMMLAKKIAGLKQLSQSALNDEHTAHNRDLALKASYFIAVITLTAAYALTTLKMVSTDLALRVAFISTTAFPMLAFAWLELKGLMEIYDDE